MDDKIIASMAAQKLGDANAQQPPQSAPPQMAESPQETPAENVRDQGAPETQMEQAQDVGAPVDESVQMNQQAATFRVPFGNEERELTPQQIQSTFERYAALNHAHQQQFAPMKPVVALAKAIQDEAAKNGRNVSGQEIAQLMAIATKALIQNPQMGKQGEAAPEVDELAQWEEENAVSLPPKYKEALQSVGGMKAQMAKMMQAMQLLAGKSKEVGQTAQQQLQTARETELNSVRASIGNNLARAQQQFGLPDEAENDFMQFAFSRGYTPEDFVDPRLTNAVVQDFKNNMNSPEMDRLRALTQKRQAYTGGLSGAPSGGVGMGGGQRNADSQFFNSMVDAALAKRG